MESVISILGLGIGLGAIFLLSMLVIHEFSFNSFVPGKKQTYRVLHGNNCQTSYMVAASAKEEIPEIEDYFRFYQAGEVWVKNEMNQVLEERLFAVADPSFFEHWPVRLKFGKLAQGPTEITLSEEMAKKYFNADNPVGSSIFFKLKDNFRELYITGVYKNLPSNSTLRPNFIGNMDLSGELFGQTSKMFGQYGINRDEYKDWKRTNYYTYFVLNGQADPDAVAQKLNAYNQHLDEAHQNNYALQPITDTYLGSGGLSGAVFSRIGDSDELRYYVAIAFVILLIAITNYVFLTRAKVMNRLTELGAKKALGATRTSITKQVLAESNLIAFLSIVPAVFIVFFGISFINESLGKSLGGEVLFHWQTWILLLIIVLLTGTVSGLFISARVSKTPAVSLLAGQTSQQGRRNIFSNSFLSFHFAIFIVLLVAVFTFKKQINYSLTNFKSINPENILICGLNTPELQKQVGVLQNELEKMPGVVRTAGSSFIPPFNDFLPVRLRSEEINIRFDGLIMGAGMIELLEMEVIDGNSFGEFETGHTNVIFNESAAVEYNIKVGEPFSGFNVRGIVKDFTAHSARRLIEPMVILQQHPEKMRFLVVKTEGKNDTEIRQKIGALIQQLSPEALVDISYLTEQINHFYRREQNQAKLITAFSVLAIILAVMGLFGIVLNTISKRTKEIGIRKVNGAEISEILGMLNRSFLKWIVISVIVACPAAWYVMTRWLENFAYKTTLSWWIFALAGGLALGIALLTVSWQSWRAATRNPVEALRYE
uniref:ABC transporter permease n=1 Tax=uncultured Draconibacterium sp. TaxID=1573823 RepID=UPI003216E921